MSKKVIDRIKAMAEVFGRAQMSHEGAALYCSALLQYPEAQVLGALDRCLQELPRFPTVADVIARLCDGRPGPEEAWAMLPRTEADSVVWTDEMALAFDACRHILGDRVAARMAFLEKYKALVTDARASHRHTRWTASLGFNQEGRRAALAEAVDKGRIGQPEALKLIPDLGTEQRGQAPALPVGITGLLKQMPR